jgi:hypothetical protein
MSRITAPRRLAATLAVGASFAAAAPAVHAEPNTGGGTPTGCQLKGKDKTARRSPTPTPRGRRSPSHRRRARR